MTDEIKDKCKRCRGKGTLQSVGPGPEFESSFRDCPKCKSEEKPKLKSIEDYVHPDERPGEMPELLSFQDAKDKKHEEPDGPRLESKFDFMDGENFIKMEVGYKFENKKKTIELHYSATIYVEHFFMSGWMEQCFSHKEVSLKWYDFFLGTKTLEDKVESIATAWMKETKIELKRNSEARKLSEEFTKKFSRD